MPNRDLKFRLLGEDVDATSTVEGVAERAKSALEGMSKKAEASAERFHKGFGGAYKVLGGIGLAAGGAAVAIAGTALKGAADVEQSNLKIAGSLGLTAKQAEHYGKLAGDVYSSNYGESMEQVQDTIGNVVSGISGMRKASDKDVTSMTSNVLSFASAFDVDASDAIQQVNQLMKSGLAKDGPAAMDLLTAAMQRVPKAVRGDLMDAVDEYAPFMHQLGLSGAQSMDLLVKSTGKGQFGLDKTGDALKEFTIRSTDMSSTTKAAYKTLGLNAHTMANDILAGGKRASGGLDTIVDRLLKIKDPAKRSNTAISLFGTQMEDLGVGQVPKFLAGLKNVGRGMDDTKGATNRLNSTISGGASNSLETLHRKWDVVTQRLVSGALPAITTVFNFLANHEGLMKVLVVGLGLVAGAVGVLTLAMWALSLTPVALMIGGIVIAVGLLIAGIVLLVQHWGDVCKFVQGAWAAVCKWLSDSLASVGKWFSDTFNGVVGFLQKWGPLILAAVMPVIGLPLLIIQHWGEIVSFFQGLGAKVIGFLVGAAKWLVDTGADILTGLIDGAKKGLIAFGRWEVGIAKAVLGWIEGAGKWLVDTGHDILTGLIDGAKKGLIAFGRWEIGIAKSVLGWVAGAGRWLLETGSDILHGLASGAKTGWKTVTSFLGGIPGKVTDALAGAGAWLKNIGGQILGGLVRGLQGAVGHVKDFFVGLTKDIPNWKGPASTDKKLLTPAGHMVIGSLVTGLNEKRGDVRTALHKQTSDIGETTKKGLATETPKVFRGIAAFVANGLVKGLKGSTDTVQSTMKDLAGKVTSAFDGLADARAASQKRLKKLDQQLDDADATTKAGKKRITALRRQITDEQSTLKQLDAVGKIGKSSLLKSLEADTAALTTLAKRRDALAGQLEKAQDALEKAKTDRTEYGANVSASAISGANIGDSYSNAVQAASDAKGKLADLGSQLSGIDDDVKSSGAERDSLVSQLAEQKAKVLSAVDEAARTDATSQVTSLTGQLVDIDKKLAGYSTSRADIASQMNDARETASQSPVQVLMGKLQKQARDTTTLGTLLGQLKSEGLDQTSYDQIVQKGVDGGGLELAQALQSEGPGAVGQIATLQGQLKTAADGLGTKTSSAMFDAGVKTAQGSVDGLTSQMAAVTGAIGVIQQQVGEQVGKLGVDTSSLMRSAGSDIAGALAQGLADRKDALLETLKHMSKAMAATVRKELGLELPKTVGKDGHGKEPASSAKHGGTKKAAGGHSPVVHIEHMHTTPNQKSSDIASDLAWLARGGL